MFDVKRLALVSFGLVVLAGSVAATVRADDELYAAPSVSDVRSRALEWVVIQKVSDPTIRERVGKIWAISDEGTSARALFEKVIATFCAVDPESAGFVEACALVGAPLVPPEAQLLSREGADEFYTANFRLFYARYLAQRRLYDEGLEAFEGLDPQTVVDPAGCLFFKAVCQHQLLMKKEGLATLKLQLENTEQVPLSYSTVAKLMQYELQALREKSLDEVARKMMDVKRRLEFGRGGQKVQKKEDEIIATLDEIIKKLEQQQGGGGEGSNSGRPQGNQSSSPAQDSYIGGQKAPGEVDRKNFRSQGGWGNLPAKAETRAKNLLNKHLPPHYKQASDAYFKKLANHRSRVRPNR